MTSRCSTIVRSIQLGCYLTFSICFGEKPYLALTI
nr:MAG TPA: hypothetical protein [Caudoviricetes sp.]